MNKYFKKTLWLLPLVVGIVVFILSVFANINFMKNALGSEYNPLHAFLMAFYPAAIASLFTVQISVVIGFSFWAFTLGRDQFGKKARDARSAMKAKHTELIHQESPDV